MAYTCRICFDTAENNDDGTFIHPCKCKGDTKWVHQNCLKKWESYKVKADIDNKLCCEICQTPYLILEPKRSLISKLIYPIEHIYYRVGAFFADVNNNASLTDKISIICLIMLCLVLSQYKEITNVTMLLFKMLAVQSVMAVCIYIEMIPYEELILCGLSTIKWINNSTTFQSFLQMQFGYENGIPIKTILLDICQAPTVGAICSSLLFLYMSCKISDRLFCLVPHVLYRFLLSGVVYILCRTTLILCMQFIEHRRRYSFIFLEYDEEEQRRITNFAEEYAEELTMIIPAPVNFYINQAVLTELFTGMQVMVHRHDIDAAIHILNNLLLREDTATELELPLVNHENNLQDEIDVQNSVELQRDTNAAAQNENNVTDAMLNNSQEGTASVNASGKQPAAQKEAQNEAVDCNPLNNIHEVRNELSGADAKTVVVTEDREDDAAESSVFQIVKHMFSKED